MAESNLAWDYLPVHLRQDFEDHLRATGEPHKWRYNTNEAPPTGDVEVLIRDFRIPPEFVSTIGMAPCPICRPSSPQYKRGHVVRSLVTGTLHAVGHCCGHKYFAAGAFERGLREADQQRRRRDNENFLVLNTGFPAACLRLADDILPWARAFDRTVKGLKAGMGKQVCASLARTADGYLQVEQGVKEPGRSGRQYVVNRSFGSQPLNGSRVLRGGDRAISCEARIRNATGAFEHLGWASEDDAILWLSTMPHDDLRKLALRFYEAASVFEDAAADLVALQQMLDEKNLALISAWSEVVHEGAPLRFFRKPETLSIWRGSQQNKVVRLLPDIWRSPIEQPLLLQEAN